MKSHQRKIWDLIGVAMQGKGRWHSKDLLAALAICEIFPDVTSRWAIHEVARISAGEDAEAFIERTRHAILHNTEIPSVPFDITQDLWVFMIAVEQQVENESTLEKPLLIEIRDPYDFMDCGEVLNITTLDQIPVSLIRDQPKVFDFGSL
jgi:hypothetical protein